MRAPLTIAAAATLGWSVPALAPACPPVAAALGIPRRRPGDPHVTLTFDDGPHPHGTPAVLDRLDAAGVQAWFFLVGEQVAQDPGMAREVADRGHRIAVHGYRHRSLLRIPPRVLRDDLDRAHETIAAATGTVPIDYRPPYGIFSASAVAEVRRRGWTALLWSHWGRDWGRRATPESIAALVLRELGPGDVVLLHDADHYSAPNSWCNTAGALDRLLPELGARGLL